MNCLNQTPHRTGLACRVALVLCLGFALAACNETNINPTSPGPVGSIGLPAINWENVNDTKSVAAEPFAYDVDAGGRRRLRLEGVNGTISITGSSGVGSVSITGERRVGSESMEDAQAHLEQLEVQVSELANEVYVRTVQPEQSQGRNYTVDYTVKLPRNFEVVIENINGEVTVSEILASTYVNLTNGRIDGNVDLPQDGIIDMMVVNGSIALGIPHNTSADFSAQTSTGNIALSNLVLHGEVRTRSSVQGRLGDGRGMITLRTANGGINVRGY